MQHRSQSCWAQPLLASPALDISCHGAQFHLLNCQWQDNWMFFFLLFAKKLLIKKILQTSMELQQHRTTFPSLFKCHWKEFKNRYHKFYHQQLMYCTSFVVDALISFWDFGKLYYDMKYWKSDFIVIDILLLIANSFCKVIKCYLITKENSEKHIFDLIFYTLRVIRIAHPTKSSIFLLFRETL